MEDFKNQVVNITNGHYSNDELVTLLELIVNELEIDTVSELARKDGKSRNGILISNRYRKINIGKQKFAIKGLKHMDLPF